MTTKTPDEQAATARDALAAVLEGMAEYGVSDEIATAETMGLANPQAIDAQRSRHTAADAACCVDAQRSRHTAADAA